MSLIHLARQGFITKSALPNVTRQRGTTTGTANLMVYGAGKTFAIGTNTTFTDSSTNNFTVTRNGDTIQATNNPFTGSVYFDGNGDYLTVPANSGFQFGTGNFTVEFWLNYSSLTNAQTIISSGYVGGTVAGGWIVQTGIGDGKVNLYFQNAINAVLVAADSGSTVLAGNWYHIAIVKNGSTVTIYRNGQSVGSGTDSNNYNANSILVIGGGSSSGYNNYWVNGYISNLRIVKGTAVYTANFSVPTSPLTAITNTSLLLLTAQQGPFRDSSTNNFTVTANGNAAGNGLEPFPVNYAGSAYFDGTGDYLSNPANAAFDFGTGDFTIEAWIYIAGNSPLDALNRRVACIAFTGTSASTQMLFVIMGNSTSTGTAVLFSNGSAGLDSTTTVSQNAWHHIAACRSGTTLRLFLDGAELTSNTSYSGSVGSTTNATWIGRTSQTGYTYDFNGYISNVRVVKGTAVYTAAFTPPTVPLTAITNTQFLLLTNNVGPFVDNGPNGFPILRNGDTVQTGFSPFTGQPSAGSGYFDGTGDYLVNKNAGVTDFGTGNFTVEYWVYPTSFNSTYQAHIGTSETANGLAFGLLQLSGIIYATTNTIGYTTNSTISLNTWTHIAWTRSGTTLNAYKNGVNVYSTTVSTNFTEIGVAIGSNINGLYMMPGGYLSNIRVVKGTALYTSNFTPATAPLPAVPNTSLLLNTDNYRIANSSSTYLPITINGDATVSTAQFPTGMDRSMYFDGNGDYLRIPDNSVVELGANNFTIEMFVNFSSLPPSSLTYSYFISKWASAQGAYNFQLSNVSNLYYLNFDYSTNGNNGFQLSVPWTPSVSTWYHIALVRNSTNLLFFVNGTQQGSTQTISATINNSNAAFVVGAYLESVNFFHGYMSNLRLTVGSALYTANFTPPSLPMSLSVTVPAYVTNNIYGVYQLA